MEDKLEKLREIFIKHLTLDTDTDMAIFDKEWDGRSNYNSEDLNLGMIMREFDKAVSESGCSNP